MAELPGKALAQELIAESRAREPRDADRGRHRGGARAAGIDIATSPTG